MFVSISQAQPLVTLQGVPEAASRRNSFLRAIADVLALAAALSCLLPLWLPRTLPPTCDGPSHVYNSMISQAVQQHDPDFSSTYKLRHFPRSNFATDTALRLLGSHFGWVTGERIWLTVLLLAQFAVFFAMLSALSIQWRLVLAAFLSNNWFLWMGFYDFTLSLALLGALILVLLRVPESWRYYALILVLSYGLYAAHLATFLLSVGVTGWVFLWRLRHKQMHWLGLAVLLLPLVLLASEASGPSAHGGYGWGGLGLVITSIQGAILADWLLTYSRVGFLLGILIMAVLWFGAWRAFRDRSNGAANAAQWWVPLLGVLLIVGSLAAPFYMGAGAYIPSRLRMIGGILLLASVNLGDPKLNFLRIPAFSALASLALLFQSVQIVKVAQDVYAKVERLKAVVAGANIPKGSWMFASLADNDDRLVRITPNRHLPARIYTQDGLRSLNNYEATIGNFEVQWLAEPTGAPPPRQDPQPWLITQLPAAAGVPIHPVWLIHDQQATPQPLNGVTADQQYTAQGLTVTRLDPK